jgi:hypothetical protein
MAGPLGHHPRLILALLRDRLDPLLYQPAGHGDGPAALFPCEPPMVVPWNTLQAMLRRGLIEAREHEGSAGRIAYVAQPQAFAEAYSPEDVLRHRATIRCWERAYVRIAARGRPPIFPKAAA